MRLINQNGIQIHGRIHDRGLNYEKISLSLLNSNFFYLDVHNPGPNPIRFTGASTQPTGWIPDPNLEKAIQQEIGEIGNPITSSKLRNLKSLKAQGLGIKDLTGLEHAQHLTELILSDNNISDISALTKLTQLNVLNLSGNNISDISALTKLTNLSRLSLADNAIDSIPSLGKLTKLNYLHLSNNKISDISALAGLGNLYRLYLAANEISDISTLAGLTGLNYLHLSNNKISDISALAGLGNLYRLDLAANEISDISALSELIRLDDLNLSNNSISDISALSGLILLDILNLSNNRVSDISPLVGLVGSDNSLKYVGIRDNPLNHDSVNTHIPAMLADGVQVIYENRTPSALMKISGDTQKGEIDTALTTPFVVEAMDASGKPMRNVSVTFTITAGEGQLSATTLTTDTNGKAETVLTLGPSLGKQTVTATATEIMPSVLTFTAIATEDPERFAADVNGDGEINIQDVVLVSSSLGQTGENDADVNGDGEVNIQDLVAVTAALGEVAAAPAALRQQGAAHLTQEEVQHWLTQAQQANLTDATSLRGIRYLEQLLSTLTPKETALLANYPNPFNPETWIPYQLSKPADVSLTIYDINGHVVRDLDLGHQRAGMYQSKSRAAYWDGRNTVGEPVASGVYFYTLTAGDFTATRKLLIRK